MLDDGALENVDAIFGLHVSARYPFGAVASRSGPISAASGFFEAVISGKGVMLLFLSIQWTQF